MLTLIIHIRNIKQKNILSQIITYCCCLTYNGACFEYEYSQWGDKEKSVGQQHKLDKQ
ncbi:hypothetical protein PGAG_00113 [Phaeocystis globosa virus 12T]|uniref:Uncharacterized protein n=1 Tax=Phaeocystis globosa virus PgV-16T TaxID=3071227 RepID=A0AC59EWV5_9VIRU|nr:hypothetical protein PGCG_00154 [Phaeocystis globosa virus]AET73002.1 hypothetical protein PGAG_00113 [Phaeocystis globosa virus 12T]AET73824.1 hypothetical protein PGBG_00116 [Phaeocystis globosa virus 14T]AGM15465.1 hypothetical protein PGCG_00154 [Phaeocystis globosa virus PgV-16T]UYE94195.1 hypothetical protein PGV14T_00154 [Phaeocystis globosa virus]